jgi:hypothetical protein
MSCSKHITIFACLLWSAVAGLAQGNPPRPPVAPTPVELFRRLISTNAAGREAFLAAKSPEARRVIEAKLREYESLSDSDREAKLRSLQLRWHTQRLMKMKAEDRPMQLAQIPMPDRSMVSNRISRFSILPPSMQQEVLTNQMAANFVFQEERHHAGVDPRQAQRMTHLMEFVEWSPTDRNKVMARLTPTEHEQMQKTLSTFTNLSKDERLEALEGFRKFAALSENERLAFLSTAQRWREMSEKDRQFWRAIVSALERGRSGPPMPLPSALKSAADSSQSLTTN